MKSDRTTFLTPESVSPKWYVIDAEGMVVGRLASKISQVLMGKHRPDYTPHVVSGDYVVVVNADKVRFTGSDMQHPDHDYYTTKMAKKSYFHHSGWVGGLKEHSALNLWKKDPTAILGLAIRRMLPKGAQMISTDVIGPFLVPLKVTVLVGLVIALPVVLYQAWAFIAPGLYAHEKKLVLPLVMASFFLFLVGMAFAYYLVFPVIFKFMAAIAPEGVT